MTYLLGSREQRVIFAAGTAATLTMMGASRVMGSPVMPRLQELAATVTSPPGSAIGHAVGVTAQLVNGGLFAEVYDQAFARTDLRPSWATGAALGFAHGVLAGVVLGAVAPMHPRVPDEVPAPGAFMRHHGTAASAVLVALHALYGALVGAAIQRVRTAHHV